MKEMMIYGAGFVGLHVCDMFLSKGVIPLCILDRDVNLRGRQWRGLIIIHPDDVTNKDVETIVCHSDQQVCNRIIASLEADGYKRSLSVYEYAKRPENSSFFFDQRNIILADRSLIKNNADSITRVLGLLSDDLSKETYSAVIEALSNNCFMGIPSLPLEQQYFPADLFVRLSSEVMVDIGGGPVGEVLDTFLITYRQNYDHYYLFDACSYVEELYYKRSDRISIEHIGVSDYNGTISIRNYMGKNALASYDGEESCRCIRIDDYLACEAITIIKADVEGMEPSVIRGAWDTIIRNRPVLELATYHYVSEYWELPLMLMNRLDDYEYYIRSYQGISETILYAVPHERSCSRSL